MSITEGRVTAKAKSVSQYGTVGFKVNDGEEWFNAPGEALNAFQYGDTIKFKHTGKNVAQIKVLKKAERTAQHARQNSWDNPARQKNIDYSAAQNRAIETVKILLEQDAVSLGTKKADREGLLQSLIQSYTAFFFNDMQTKASLAEAQEVKEDLEEDLDDGLDDDDFDEEPDL